MKSRLSRRKFLGGAAAAIGLPYLESLEAPAHAAVACGSRQRFIAGFVPNGMHMPDFTPTTAGKDWAMPYILEPLESIRSKIAVVTGIDYQQTAHPASPPGGHGSGTGSFLTMRSVNGRANDPDRTSIDQRIALETAACNRPLGSLQLGIKTIDVGCDGAPSCSFLTSISWLKNTPRSNITDPRTAFDTIFKGFDPSVSAADADKRKVTQTSILNHCLEEAKDLQRMLGKNDRHKLDEYMTAISEVEKQIQNQGAGSGSCAAPMKSDLDETAPYEQRVPVMLELMALALQCDVTRVGTFMFARGTSKQDWKFLLGSTAIHHEVSHHMNNAAQLAKLKEIGRWEMEQWAKFLIRLDGMKEADGTSVLDSSLAYFNSEISDGNSHYKFDMPIMLAGSAGGKLKVDGSHYMYTQMPTIPRPLVGPKGGPHGIKLFVSMLNAFGIMDQTFGDGSASDPLSDLMV